MPSGASARRLQGYSYDPAFMSQYFKEDDKYTNAVDTMPSTMGETLVGHFKVFKDS